MIRDALVLAVIQRQAERQATTRVRGRTHDERVVSAARNIWRSALANRNVTALATHPGAIRLLWEVCQIPDFRKSMSDSHARFLAAFTGAESQMSATALMVKTPRGNIEVVTPVAFVERFGVSAPDVSRGARLAALRFSMADASLLAGVPGEAGIAGLYAENSTVIGREDAMGAVLIFEPSR